jgi:histidine ammonia-lyase
MIEVDGRSLTLESVEAVARGAAAALSHAARRRVERSHALVNEIVRAGRPV